MEPNTVHFLKVCAWGFWKKQVKQCPFQNWRRETRWTVNRFQSRNLYRKLFNFFFLMFHFFFQYANKCSNVMAFGLGIPATLLVPRYYPFRAEGAIKVTGISRPFWAPFQGSLKSKSKSFEKQAKAGPASRALLLIWPKSTRSRTSLTFVMSAETVTCFAQKTGALILLNPGSLGAKKTGAYSVTSMDFSWIDKLRSYGS